MRPEHLQASPAGAEPGAPARVQVVEHLGDITYLYLSAPCASETLTVKASPDNPLRSGDATRLAFPADRCYLFDERGGALPQL